MQLSDDEKVDDVLDTLDGFKNWKEGSESTPERPSWIRIGTRGVVGRVTFQPKMVDPEKKWYYDYVLRDAREAAYASSLQQGKLAVERGLRKLKAGWV